MNRKFSDSTLYLHIYRNLKLLQDNCKLPDTNLEPPTIKRMIPLPVIGIDDNDPMLRDNEGSIIVSKLTGW